MITSIDIEGSEEFKEAVRDFIEFCKEINETLTKSDFELFANKFNEFVATIERCKKITKKNKRTVFVPPTAQEVQKYCTERNNNINAEKFVAYYTANGWMVGKVKMKDWKAAVRTWELRSKDYVEPDKPKVKPSGFNNFEQKATDFDEIRRKKRESLKMETMTNPQ